MTLCKRTAFAENEKKQHNLRMQTNVKFNEDNAFHKVLIIYLFFAPFVFVNSVIRSTLSMYFLIYNFLRL